jgi:hypothetical protein
MIVSPGTFHKGNKRTHLFLILIVITVPECVLTAAPVPSEECSRQSSGEEFCLGMLADFFSPKSLESWQYLRDSTRFKLCGLGIWNLSSHEA